MNEIAEKGYAAHVKYKQGAENESGLEDWLNRLKETLEKVNKKLKKNIGVYRNNLKLVGREVESLCIDFGEQSKQIKELKSSLVELT